jgi:lysophospholipase L1-like esterase
VNGAWLAVSNQETKLADSDDSAVTPLWRDGNWLQRHEGFVADAKKGGVDLLFVGDSITDFWRNRGKAVWDKYYGQLHAADIGISGDRTQHLLWRLQQGEVDGLRPKAIVLMIGTNNTGLEGRGNLAPRNTPAEAAEGVAAVVNELRRRLPEAKILLLAVFPRGHTPDDPQRVQVAAINRIIQGLDDGDHVRFLDIGSKFLGADGTLSKEIMPDYLHPNAKGYEIWAQAIQPSLDQLLGAAK